MKRLDDHIDKEIDRSLNGMVMYSELGERYELIQKHYPNILARLEAAAERREEKLKCHC